MVDQGEGVVAAGVVLTTLVFPQPRGWRVIGVDASVDVIRDDSGWCGPPRCAACDSEECDHCEAVAMARWPR